MFNLCSELKNAERANRVEVQSFAQGQRKFGFGSTVEQDVQIVNQLALVFGVDIQIVFRNIAFDQFNLLQLLRCSLSNSIEDL